MLVTARTFYDESAAFCDDRDFSCKAPNHHTSDLATRLIHTMYRYKEAVEDYEQMMADIKEADEAAKEYFNVQTEYTEKISNPRLKERAEESDKAEIEAYLRWRSRANGIILTAEPIMQHLKDIDAIIQKQNLSAHFLALRESLDSLPVSVSSLYSQVELFHQESMAIQDTFNRLPTKTDIEPSTETTDEKVMH